MLILSSDQMLTCPLDEAHRIRKERMQFHLVKCSKNHTLKRKLKCPWNPLHIIDKFAWEDHWRRECENMPAALEFICQTEEPRDVASVPVNTSRSLLPPSDEDWDAEPYAVGTYDPFKNAAGKLVLRSKVGLSKAKKKQWIQEERKRHQELEAMGPLSLTERHNPQEKNIPGLPNLRPPRKQAVALSTDVSTIDKLNSSKVSEKGDKKKKVKKIVDLRKPHAPSPSVRPNVTTPLKPKNTNDEKLSLNDVDVDSGDLYSDAGSMVSSVSCTRSRNADIEKIRKLLEKSSISPTGADETDDDITQRLANLTTMENSIQDERAALLQQMSKYVPKLVNPKSSNAPSIMENGSDQATSNRNVSPIPNLTTGKPETKFTNPIVKCAAAFSGPKKAANAPATGTGRGTIIDFSAFKKRAPGKENAGGNSARKYVQNTSTDEIGSVFGYEEDDD